MRSVQDPEIGRRYLHGRTLHPLTVRYIGPLPSVTHTAAAGTASESESVSASASGPSQSQIQDQDQKWYGVEYDEHSRGRHSGTFQGTRVFRVSHQGAGAFLKASEGILKAGPSFAQALQERYGPISPASHVGGGDRLVPTSASSSTSAGGSTTGAQGESSGSRSGDDGDGGGGHGDAQRILLGSSGGNILIEAPGMDDVARRISKLERLREIGLEGRWVAELGGDDHDHVLDVLRDRLKGVRILNISQNLLSSWEDVVRIVSCLTSLKILVLNESRIPTLTSGPPLSALQGILELHLGNCGLTWAEVLALSSSLPTLETLHLNDNPLLGTLDTPPASRPAFTSLKSLTLEGCPIPTWHKLLDGLVHLPSLSTLNISSVPIASIPVAQVTLPGITHLIAHKSLLKQWSDIHNLSQHLPNLASLRITPSTYSDGMSKADISGDDKADRPLFIAIFPQLLSLNSTAISATERRDAEMFYLAHVDRHFSDKQGWGCYDELARKHDHQVSVPKPKTRRAGSNTGLRSKMITLHVVPSGSSLFESFEMPMLPSAPVSLLIRKISRQIGAHEMTRLWTCRDPLGGEGEGKQRVADLTEERGEVGMWFVDGDSALVDVT